MHPGDQARKTDLTAFAEKDDTPIPAVIGVKMFDVGVRGKIDLQRVDKQTGRIGHRYMTQPTNKAVILAYPSKNSGEVDFSKPHIASVRQNLAVVPEAASAFKSVPDKLRDGITLGTKGNSGGSWKRALEEYLRDCGFHSYTMLTPGCVLCYNDGRTYFIRNFKQGSSFSKGILRYVIGVRRTPFVDRLVPLKILT